MIVYLRVDFFLFTVICTTPTNMRGILLLESFLWCFLMDALMGCPDPTSYLNNWFPDVGNVLTERLQLLALLAEKAAKSVAKPTSCKYPASNDW